MALTEYKVDRVRSRTASCNGLDRWIYDDIFEGIDNVVTLLFGCWPARVEREARGRRTETAQAIPRSGFVHGRKAAVYRLVLMANVGKPPVPAGRHHLGKWCGSCRPHERVEPISEERNVTITQSNGSRIAWPEPPHSLWIIGQADAS